MITVKLVPRTPQKTVHNILISARAAGKDNPAFVHDEGKPETGKQVGSGLAVGQQGGVPGLQQQGAKEGSKKVQEEDHEFDIEGKSVVSGKKRTGWM